MQVDACAPCDRYPTCGREIKNIAHANPSTNHRAQTYIIAKSSHRGWFARQRYSKAHCVRRTHHTKVYARMRKKWYRPSATGNTHTQTLMPYNMI